MKKGKKNNFFDGTPKNILIGLIITVGLILLLTKMTDYTRQFKTLTFSNLEQRIENHEVKRVHFAGQDVTGQLKDGSYFETVVPENHSLWDVLKKNQVEYSVANTSGNQMTFWYLLIITFIIGLLIAGWFFFRQARSGSNNGGGGNIFSMGKSRARMFMPSTIKENFNSVAGATEAKEELQELVEYLRNPEKFRRLGAKITRGVLLVGEPGNGKTLLAKAVAGEANCPFFSISGSDFIEVFVGVGAARVRDLFAQARKHAPSIVFIDEIDAVGRHRGSGLGGGHDEREQTLNQLLTEMDGFQTVGGAVIVLAATNRPDVLDKALLRPGRFDRRVEVPYPDLVSRESILRLHAKSTKIDPEVNMLKLARGTPGFTGADLANLINEAALNASKYNQDSITIKDFEEARDKILLGKELKTISLSEHERKITAYHEAGHALVRLMMPEITDPLHKVTIVPRGRALGVTHSMPEREKYNQTKQEMVASIMAALGGRAAEEITFKELTTGAYSDFKTATHIARKMICDYGMSENLGPIVYTQRQGEYEYSEKTAEAIDKEVYSLIDECYKKAVSVLSENQERLEKLAQALLEKETMFAGEIYELLGIEPRQEHLFT